MRQPLALLVLGPLLGCAGHDMARPPVETGADADPGAGSGPADARDAAGGTGTTALADAASLDALGAPPTSPDAAPAIPPDIASPAAQPRCPAGPFEVPKVGARKDICAGFQVKYDWSEGPTWVARQHAFFFSNFVMSAPGPGDMIKYDPASDHCEVFIEGNGCNGLAVDNDGDSIIATCQTPRALLKFDLATKKSTILVDMVGGQMLDSPNDVAIHSNGTIYFSNTTLELGGRVRGLGPALLYLDPRHMVHVVATGSINPLALSPDQKRLYAMGGYWDLDDDGVPVKKNAGFTLGNDGLAVDCAGNLYTQSGQIVSPQNQTIGRFAGGTNAAFGGDDGKLLLVVNGRTMHTLDMNVPGLPE